MVRLSPRPGARLLPERTAALGAPVAALCLLASTGCGSTCTTTDAGPVAIDSGPTVADTGPLPLDSGPPDSGLPDSGPPDSGPLDGGPPPVVFTPGEWAILATLSPLPALPPDPTNAVADDPAAALLGQRLFFDARYSGPLAVASDLGAIGDTGRVSCASCHSSLVMSDDRSVPDNVSLGTNFHTRNAPAIVNSAFSPWTNWGGRFSAQWELPPVVAENGIIMNSTRLQIAHHIFDNYRTEYEALFGAMEPAIGTDPVRFPPSGKPKASATAPDGPWETMTAADQAIVNRIFINFGKLLQAYMRLLVSRDAPFDQFVAGTPGAITEGARRGLRLFIGEARCVTCHSGPTFSDGLFHNLGVPQTGMHVPMIDDGRYTSIPPLLSSPFNSAGAYSDDPATGTARLAGLTNPPPASARGAFRTPTLRGVELSAPYMHAGQHATLEDVIAFYAAGGAVPVSGTRDPQLFPLPDLDAQDQADLFEFLLTLSGTPVDMALRMAPP